MHPLYSAALAADNAYHAALVARYGPEAANRRYLPHSDPELTRLAAEKVVADQAWLDYFRKLNNRTSAN